MRPIGSFLRFVWLLASALLLTTWHTNAQTVVNGNFEADSFTVSPGDVADNGPITGWTVETDTNGTPMNMGIDGNFNVYTDNGTIPNGGTRAAFMVDSTLLVPASLSQVVSNFVVGRKYQLQYYENASAYYPQNPALSVTVGGVTVVPQHVIQPVGGTNLYNLVTSSGFTATNTALKVAFLKNSPSDASSCALITGVSIVAPTDLVITATAPSGVNVPSTATISFTIENFNTTLNASSVQLTLNGTQVTPTIVQSTDFDTISYTPPTGFELGSTNSVSLVFADNETPPVSSTNQFDFVVSSTVSGLGAYTNAVLADSPLLYGRLQETNGPTAFDTSGNGNFGVYEKMDVANSGSLVTQAGPIIGAGESAVYFNGDWNFDYVIWNTNTDNVNWSLPAGNNYTMEWWFYPIGPFNVYPLTGYMICRGDGNYRYDAVGIGGTALSEGQIFFYNGAQIISGTTVLQSQKWYYCAMVRSNTTVSIYLNGKLEGSGYAELPAFNYPFDLYLGIRCDHIYPFKGAMAEFAFYDKALTATQIANHWNSVPLPPVINIVRDGSNVVLTWTGGGTLQEATQLTGPWTNTGGGTAASPYTAAISGSAKFYRLVP